MPFNIVLCACKCDRCFLLFYFQIMYTHIYLQCSWYVTELFSIPHHGVGRGLQECTPSVRQSVRPSVRPSVTCRGRSITFVCIGGLQNNLVQMLSSLRQCAVTYPESIPQRSRSHETFNGQSTHPRVHSITFICIDGLQSNLVQMLSLLRQYAYKHEYLGYRSNNLYFLFSHS